MLGHNRPRQAVVHRERYRLLGSWGLQTAPSRRADFIPTIQVAAVGACLNPHGVHTRQLQVQRKMLNRKDSTVVLVATSRQWRDTDKFRSVESHVFMGSVCGPSGVAAKLGTTYFRS